MHTINTKGLLLRIFIPTSLLSLAYLLLGQFSKIPHLLLFCILGTVVLMPIELGIILSASKKEYGTYSLKSALCGQEKMPVWNVLHHLPTGFDWTDMEYLRSFARPTLVLTCIYYSIFNVLLGPITEELFFRLPFNNVFRIAAFAPAAYAAYRKKNLYISMCFHCFCNLFSVIGFILAI